MIVVIRMNNCEIFLGELVSDDIDSITIDKGIKVFQTPTPMDNGSGTYYTAHIPILLNPFGINTKVSLKKKDIMFYDIADDYYHLYHDNCFGQLWESEINKQNHVMKMYNGEDESNLQYDNEDKGEPIVGEDDQNLSTDELLAKIDSAIDKSEESVYNVTLTGKPTLH